MSSQFINPDGLFVSTGYTQVVAVAGKQTIYISGQVALNATGDIIGVGDLAAQTRQVYENLRLALEAVGASFTDIVKTTTFVVDTNVEKVKTVRDIRSQYHTGPNPPASTYIGVQDLAVEGLLIEIEAIVAM